MDKNLENFKLKIKRLINHYDSGNYKFVILKINILLKKLPNNPFILNLLGSCYQRIGDLNTAKKVFLRIIEIDKNNISAMNNLANTFKDLSDFKMAENYYKKVLDINPNFINTISNYGNLNFQLNKYEEAISFYKKALNIDNNSTVIHYNAGLAYQSYGKFKDAEFHFKELLRIDPNMTLADRLISKFTKYDENNTHLKEMLTRTNIKTLNEHSKVNLYFALGKAYEDLFDYKKSFFYLEQANIIKDKICKYNADTDNKLFADIKKFFKDFNLNKKYPIRVKNKKIIFILGMPRSGTSLVEQIISTHSKVYGSGELDFLEKIMRKDFFKNERFNAQKLLTENNKDTLNKIASYYYDLINNFESNKEHITDKAPQNFKWIGFIKILFPNSKIIHCTRDAKDNCLSLYKNIFDENLNWSYDQNHLFNFYKNYYELMKFWKNKIPEFIFDVNYEKLILNPKIEMKKLVKFCDLEWEDQCLEFYKTKRAIKTVSVSQARQPIYKSSISSNNNYKSFLPELFSNLDNLV